MKRFLFFTLLLLFLSNSLIPAEQSPDAEVKISQQTINKFLSTIGPIKGEQTGTTGMGFSYDWTLLNPQITILPGKASFSADVKVRTKWFTYPTKAKGDVSIKYQEDTNNLLIKIENTAFELYTKANGKKDQGTFIDISKLFKPEFTVPGPGQMESFIDFTMPNGKKEKIKVTARDQQIQLQQSNILLTYNLEFNRP